MKTRLLRSRLALRIYLAGLAQIAAVLLGFTLLVHLSRLAGAPGESEARDAAEAVVAKLGDEAGLARELKRVRTELDATIAVYDADGEVIATNRREGDPPFPGARGGALRPPRPAHPPPGPPLFVLPFAEPPDGARHHPPGPPFLAFVLPMDLPDGRSVRVVYAARRPPGPPGHGVGILITVLVVVGVASLLTARSIARPLARLSAAARAFGDGQLETRTRLSRSDEIGDVAAAFDEMADRVTGLLRAEKELLANVSHELRTPLARIRVALDLAVEGSAEVARESLADIAEDLAELERLIGDVLTAARLDLASGQPTGGVPPLRRESVDVRELVERAAAKFRAAHPERALAVEIGPDLPPIQGDPVLLRRVVDNLLDNAHEYSPRVEDGVELRVGRDDREIRIEVQDQGIGIAEGDLPHVFRPFFRADRSRARATGGLGLGLALARRIVDAHRGTIALASRAGEGTRAEVRLPIDDTLADAKDG